MLNWPKAMTSKLVEQWDLTSVCFRGMFREIVSREPREPALTRRQGELVLTLAPPSSALRPLIIPGPVCLAFSLSCLHHRGFYTNEVCGKVMENGQGCLHMSLTVLWGDQSNDLPSLFYTGES